MTTIEILGASGFALSLAHICWQVWWQHRQNRERLRTDVSLGAKPCVKVHNIGPMPVHLTGVQLVVKQDGATLDYPFQKVVVRRALPREAGRAAPIHELVANADRLKIWISVCSNAGEIYRLTRKHTLVYLRTLVEDGN